MFTDENIISVYTRKDAINDGMLVDVSDTPEAKEAGFKIPVCLTSLVHALCEVPEGMEGMQDYKGRLWDTLWMAANTFKMCLKKGNEEDCRIVSFKVAYQMSKDKMITADLWLVFNKVEGFTVMLPEDY